MLNGAAVKKLRGEYSEFHGLRSCARSAQLIPAATPLVIAVNNAKRHILSLTEQHIRAPIQPRSAAAQPALRFRAGATLARDQGGGRREYVQEKRALVKSCYVGRCETQV